MLDGFTPWPPEVAAGYRDAGYWRGTPLGRLAAETARREPERTALITAGRRISYGELDRRADALAAGMLQAGLVPGDRIIVQLPNGAAFVETVLAAFRAGVLPVLTLPSHRISEIGYLARHVDAAAYVAPATLAGFDYRELAGQLRQAAPTVRHVWIDGEPGPYRRLADVSAAPRALPEPDPSRPAFFLLSGGTTGLPKLIPRTHDDYHLQLRRTAEEMGFDADGVYLAALPVAHNAALGCPGLLGALLLGATTVLAASPSPDEVFPLIAAHGVSLTTLMPAFVALWVELAGDYAVELSGVTIEVGGAKLEPETARGVRPALGATLTHWFGMAEGPLCFTRPGDGDEAAATTQGHPLHAADELRIVDTDGADVADGAVGELLYRGPTTLRGYYRAEAYNGTTFTPDGYLRTGDLVRMTPEGALVVTGRVKDVINRGGEKVAAEEVEEHLLTHPAVRRVAVIAVPDAALGEKSCAVVLADGAAPTLRELRDHLAGRGVADYKYPDRLELVTELPYTPIGKVDKKRLRDRYATAAPVPGI